MDELIVNIFIGKDSLIQLSLFLSSNSFSQIFVLVDENTREHCYPRLVSLLPTHHLIQIKSGEQNKTLDTCELIWSKLTNENADRNSLLINLGGGVIGDMGGFAAACYKRGLKFINLPTTLLAMVDASVGGKTGIDFMCFKNQIGLFNEPEAIFIQTDFLNTLPERQLKSGFAEVIKHYLIADKDAFKAIGNSVDWNSVVERNVKIKSLFVKQDPHEHNIRKALNFGHTIGHAIESYFLKKEVDELLHGEAIAVGMICESFISKKLNLITEEELRSISKVVLSYFQLPLLPVVDFSQLLELIKQDKKGKAQQNQFSLLKEIGNYSINNSVEGNVIIESFNYYNKLLA